MSSDDAIWENQWNVLIQKALRQLANVDLETKARFSEGLGELQYTARKITRELVESLQHLMERLGL